MNLIRFALGLSLLFSCACSSFYSYRPLTTARLTDDPFAATLSSLLDRIERGDAAAWRQFGEYRERVEGEHATTYAIACAELWHRDPAFYLQQCLQHPDDPEVRHVAALGYRSAPRFKGTIDRFLFARMNSAKTDAERRRIKAFIDMVTGRKFLAHH